MKVKKEHQVYSYFRKLTLENIRCFGKKQSVEFYKENQSYPNWTVIIGNNGTGKTTILRTLALMLLFRREGSQWRKFVEGSYFLRKGDKPGLKPLIHIEVDSCREGEKVYTRQDFVLDVSKGDISLDGLSQGPYLEESANGLRIFAYGASRTIAESALTKEQDFPAISLFDENATLVNAEEWLVQADYLSMKDKNLAERRDQIKSLLMKLFKNEISDIEITTQNQKPAVLFKTAHGWVNLHNLSLGYKTLIAWMVDFARGMFSKYPDSPNPLAEPAVLLIDELDLHIHPKFQYSLIDFLSKTFPKTQFIVTAHSPLIVQSASQANIVLLKKRGDSIKIENDPAIVRNWRIDQVLTSDLFGLKAAREPVAEKKIRRRRDLLRLQKRNEEQEKELASLDEELQDLPVTESYDALKAIEIIKKAAQEIEDGTNR